MTTGRINQVATRAEAFSPSPTYRRGNFPAGSGRTRRAHSSLASFILFLLRRQRGSGPDHPPTPLSPVFVQSLLGARGRAPVFSARRPASNGCSVRPGGFQTSARCAAEAAFAVEDPDEAGLDSQDVPGSFLRAAAVAHAKPFETQSGFR